jgi:hypothetical protein
MIANTSSTYHSSPAMFAVVGFTLICHSMASVAWFEIGSLFCGVSTTANFLIFGRAVAGIGAAGSQFFSFLLLC